MSRRRATKDDALKEYAKLMRLVMDMADAGVKSHDEILDKMVRLQRTIMRRSGSDSRGGTTDDTA